jgi:biopolymer transport protein ExbD
MARIPWRVRIGVGLILLGFAWFGGWSWWAATRIWTPLDIPVSLSKGHIRSPEFKINLESSYYVEIVSSTECPSTPRVSWSLSNKGRVVAARTNDSAGLWLGYVEAGEGSYTLDLDVSGDAGCLDAGTPRLLVSESWGIGRAKVDDAMNCAFLVSLLLLGEGFYLVIHGCWERRAEKRAARARAWSLTQPGPLAPLAGDARRRIVPALATARPYSWTIDRNRHRKLWLPNVPASSRLSWFSLLLVNCLVLLLIITLLQTPLMHMGLPVRLVRPGIPAQSTPWLEPLRLRVAYVGPKMRPHLYLNSQPIAWEDLGAVLQKELNRRPPHWPVYVEGDPYLQWQDVAKAIDIIQGTNGEVVLLGSATTLPRPSH